VLPQKLYHGEAVTTAATLPTIDGAGPALATITTPDEHAFVLTQVLANLEQPMPEDAPLDAYWLGATAPGGDGSLRTGWVWTNGEAWDYAPWDGGEPNNENETALSIWGAFAERPFGTWNNLLPAAREDNPLHRVWALVEWTTPRQLTCRASGGGSALQRGARADCVVSSSDTSWEVVEWTADFVLTAPAGDGVDSTSRLVFGPRSALLTAGQSWTWSGTIVADTKLAAVIRYRRLPGDPQRTDTLEVSITPAPRSITAVLEFPGPPVRSDTLVEGMPGFPRFVGRNDQITLGAFAPRERGFSVSLDSAVALVAGGPNDGAFWGSRLPVRLPSDVFVLPALVGTPSVEGAADWYDRQANTTRTVVVADGRTFPACRHPQIASTVQDFVLRHEGATADGPSHREIWNDALARAADVQVAERLAARSSFGVRAQLEEIWWRARDSSSVRERHDDLDRNDTAEAWIAARHGCALDFYLRR
jgi:hypothetical protein